MCRGNAERLEAQADRILQEAAREQQRGMESMAEAYHVVGQFYNCKIPPDAMITYPDKDTLELQWEEPSSTEAPDQKT